MAKPRLRWQHGLAMYAKQTKCTCDLCEEAIEGARMRTVRLPFEPLLRRLPPPVNMPAANPSASVWTNHDHMTVMVGGVSLLTPTQQRAWYRAQQVGYLVLNAADELATALGFHPTDIWGSDWWDA